MCGLRTQRVCETNGVRVIGQQTSESEGGQEEKEHISKSKFRLVGNKRKRNEEMAPIQSVDSMTEHYATRLKQDTHTHSSTHMEKTFDMDEALVEGGRRVYLTESRMAVSFLFPHSFSILVCWRGDLRRLPRLGKYNPVSELMFDESSMYTRVYTQLST